MTGNRKRNGIFDNPRLAIGAGAGALILVVCAIVFFTGSAGSPAGLTAPVTVAATPSPQGGMPLHAVAYPGTPGVLAYDVVMTAGYELADAVVPEKGVFVRVVYRGGYAGSWTSGNESGDIRDSGERVVAIENPGPSLDVDLVKLDNSAKQPFTVEIWKDGARRATNSTSLPFGEVTVSAGL
jgi:hypothetical protein